VVWKGTENAMTAPLSDREKLARELCRWDWDDRVIGPETVWGDRKSPDQPDRERYRREADRILKMVCGSCGLAIPLMGKGKKK
jgi:hypothetical protein